MNDKTKDEREPLRPETALPLLRSSSWHPGTIGVMVSHLMDWLTDTGQIDARDELHGIQVTSPFSADGVRLGDIGEADRRAAARSKAL